MTDPDPPPPRRPTRTLTLVRDKEALANLRFSSVSPPPSPPPPAYTPHHIPPPPALSPKRSSPSPRRPSFERVHSHTALLCAPSPSPPLSSSRHPSFESSRAPLLPARSSSHLPLPVLVCSPAPSTDAEKGDTRGEWQGRYQDASAGRSRCVALTVAVLLQIFRESTHQSF